MKTRLLYIAVVLVGGIIAAHAADQATTETNALYFPHEHVQKFAVKEVELPYEKKLMMQENDAVIFLLPNHKPVSVWCRWEDEGFALGEQKTRSNLKTA